jgi:hypothetical protein
VRTLTGLAAASREPAELIFAVEETQIRISSSALPLERLLELTDSLVEA